MNSKPFKAHSTEGRTSENGGKGGGGRRRNSINLLLQKAGERGREGGAGERGAYKKMNRPSERSATTASRTQWKGAGATATRQTNVLLVVVGGGELLANASTGAKTFLDFIVVKHLLEVEQKVCRIRNSRTPIPESFYDQCNSFESIFARKLNLIDCSHKYSTKPPNALPAALFEKINRFGPFFGKPQYLAMDLLFAFEIAKTFPSYAQLNFNDKIALCSNIAMSFAMKMGDRLLCKAVQPFNRLRLSTEEFVLVRAIIYSHMVTPGLSDHGQKLLFTEAEKYSSLLMRNLQMNYGHAASALQYVELMGLVEGLPPVLAQISTKGPLESYQLLPY
ncbi:hypothetical protein niasHS_004723 [Heterodera schachtii]|uniref:NR LBD domain-containing protein n=2 Tax=Heterodera TaxID=34509 RepID=A0ABD2JTH7_HETSC